MIHSKIAERFWSKVHVAQRARCWPWLGSKDALGYGQFRQAGKTIRAPRVAYWLRNGEWPENACHKCDNAICCNPDHLFDGSRSDNMADMVKKGRHRTGIGESHAGSVLTNAKVLGMREEYKQGASSMEFLASKYGCSFSTVQRVIKRQLWKHVH